MLAWLLPTDESVQQCSPVSPGTCSSRPEPDCTEVEGGRHIHCSRGSRLGLAKCSDRM
jgi:hypothetical protein